MLASAQAGSPTRLDRAREVGRDPSGRPSPRCPPASAVSPTVRSRTSFPTLDRSVFDETLARSVQVDAPPPLDTATVATKFSALTTLVRDGFFTPGGQAPDVRARHRRRDARRHRKCRCAVEPSEAASSSSSGSVSSRIGSIAPTERPSRDTGPSHRPRPRSTVWRDSRAARRSPKTQLQAAARGGRVGGQCRRKPAGRSREASSRSLAPLFAALALLGVALLVVRGLFPPGRRAYDSASASHVGGL